MINSFKRYVRAVMRLIVPKLRGRSLNAYLSALEFKAQLSLVNIQNKTADIEKNDIILFCCLRNESRRMQYFFNYYKKLGVDHFILIDNGSTDGIKELCMSRNDVTLFYTDASFKEAKFGMLWINWLLKKYGTDHWCVVVDPDEFLVYPHIQTRSLKALGSFLEEVHSPCLHVMMVDTYSDKSLNETILNSGDNPFDVCPYFDHDGYIQAEGWGGSTWIRGGPRMRVYFSRNPHQSPALNKIPFIKWKSSYHYRSAAHDLYPLELNRLGHQNADAPTGVLFHFKMVSNLLEKSHEEMGRAQHYSNSLEYKQYNINQKSEFFKVGISVRYQGSWQLVNLGLMRKGSW